MVEYLKVVHISRDWHLCLPQIERQIPERHQLYTSMDTTLSDKL